MNFTEAQTILSGARRDRNKYNQIVIIERYLTLPPLKLALLNQRTRN